MNHRFVTITTYANLCKINRESVYKRIKAGKLHVSEYCEHPLIDLQEYPPNKKRHEKTQVEVKQMPSWMYD
jgi:hypothetical protein